MLACEYEAHQRSQRFSKRRFGQHPEGGKCLVRLGLCEARSVLKAPRRFNCGDDLIELLAAEPRVGVLEASRRLGVARGTVQARLDRMTERGVITGYGPEVDPAALGYEVTAFITIEIRQAGGHDPVAERLAAIPEVLEVHTITGAGDMLCRVVARSNADLQRVLDAITSAEGVVRSSTLISLAAQVPYRILPLVRAAAGR